MFRGIWGECFKFNFTAQLCLLFKPICSVQIISFRIASLNIIQKDYQVPLPHNCWRSGESNAYRITPHSFPPIRFPRFSLSIRLELSRSYLAFLILFRGNWAYRFLPKQLSPFLEERKRLVDPCECYKKGCNHSRFSYGQQAYEVAEYGKREKIKKGMWLVRCTSARWGCHRTRWEQILSRVHG